MVELVLIPQLLVAIYAIVPWVTTVQTVLISTNVTWIIHASMVELVLIPQVLVATYVTAP